MSSPATAAALIRLESRRLSIVTHDRVTSLAAPCICCALEALAATIVQWAPTAITTAVQRGGVGEQADAIAEPRRDCGNAVKLRLLLAVLSPLVISADSAKEVLNQSVVEHLDSCRRLEHGRLDTVSDDHTARYCCIVDAARTRQKRRPACDSGSSGRLAAQWCIEADTVQRTPRLRINFWHSTENAPR